MTRKEIAWEQNNNNYCCYRLSDKKILGEVGALQSYWAKAGNDKLGRYISLEAAKRAVEFALTGEKK